MKSTDVKEKPFCLSPNTSQSQPYSQVLNGQPPQQAKYGAPVACIAIPFSWLCKTPEAGSRTTVYCAVDESLADKSGRYYSDCEERSAAVQADSLEDAKRLWEVSERLVGLPQLDV